MAERKTIDVWYIFVNYGDGMPNKPEDADCTELGYWQFKVNKRAYEQNCHYPINTRKGRMARPNNWSEEKHLLDEAKARVCFYKMILRELPVQTSNESESIANTRKIRVGKLKRAEENLTKLKQRKQPA